MIYKTKALYFLDSNLEEVEQLEKMGISAEVQRMTEWKNAAFLMSDVCRIRETSVNDAPGIDLTGHPEVWLRDGSGFILNEKYHDFLDAWEAYLNEGEDFLKALPGEFAE